MNKQSNSMRKLVSIKFNHLNKYFANGALVLIMSCAFSAHAQEKMPSQFIDSNGNVTQISNSKRESRAEQARRTDDRKREIEELNAERMQKFEATQEHLEASRKREESYGMTPAQKEARAKLDAEIAASGLSEEEYLATKNAAQASQSDKNSTPQYVPKNWQNYVTTRDEKKSNTPPRLFNNIE
jgi:cytoskeletal protein RodZ